MPRTAAVTAAAVGLGSIVIRLSVAAVPGWKLATAASHSFNNAFSAGERRRPAMPAFDNTTCRVPR